MTHVLICSNEFDVGAEGICTGRLTRALLDAGCRVTVATTPRARTTYRHELLQYEVLPTAPARPSKLLFRLGPLLGHVATYDYIWSRRVAHLRLKELPDLVYGRANPFSSAAAAHGLAVRRKLPLWTHFSDPVPSPWHDPKHADYGLLLGGARRLGRESQALTLTNAQALAFEQKVLSVNLDAFVLNHVAPQPVFLPPRKNVSGRVFAYFGLFYAERKAHALLEGFHQHLRHYPEDRLLFVGTEPQTVLPEAERLGISQVVRVMARVDDVRQVMGEVDVLVATDSFLGVPVFLSTKLVEYLMVNRPVVLISPAQSPGTQLLARFPETAKVATSEAAQIVSEGLAAAASIQSDDSAYQTRFAKMEDFSPRAVSRRFLAEAEARGIC